MKRLFTVMKKFTVSNFFHIIILKRLEHWLWPFFFVPMLLQKETDLSFTAKVG